MASVPHVPAAATPSKASPNGVETIKVVNPVTQEIIGEVVNTPPAGVKEAVERARYAQRLWGAMSVSHRITLLKRFRDLLWERQAEAIKVLRQETGKNSAGAFQELYGIDASLTWLLHHAAHILQPQRRPALFPILQKATVYYKPRGVVGFIMPWNYPALLTFIDCLPALAAGNAIVIKPSEIAPFITLFIVDLMVEAGIPRDVVQVVTGGGATAAALVPEVDYVAFTGSLPTARKVALQAAEHLIPYTLELGGKNAMIVLKDADLELAASGLIAGSLENAGQICVGIERVYVEASIYELFVERVKHYLTEFKVGAGDGFDVHMGSLTNETELLRVEAHVEDALNKGAVLVRGGNRRPDLGPLFYEPALLANVDHTMDVMREETFAPVIPIMSVRDAEEAIKLANDSPYGLSGSIFTRDLVKGEHLARQFNTGDVAINRTSSVVVGSVWLPWGGEKLSGVGRRGGPEGLLRFVTTQSVVVDRRWERTPGVTHTDPMIMFGIELMRRIRRVLPFI